MQEETTVWKTALEDIYANYPYIPQDDISTFSVYHNLRDDTVLPYESFYNRVKATDNEYKALITLNTKLITLTFNNRVSVTNKIIRALLRQEEYVPNHFMDILLQLRSFPYIRRITILKDNVFSENRPSQDLKLQIFRLTLNTDEISRLVESKIHLKNERLALLLDTSQAPRDVTEKVLRDDFELFLILSGDTRNNTVIPECLVYREKPCSMTPEDVASSIVSQLKILSELESGPLEDLRFCTSCKKHKIHLEQINCKPCQTKINSVRYEKLKSHLFDFCSRGYKVVHNFFPSYDVRWLSNMLRCLKNYPFLKHMGLETLPGVYKIDIIRHDGLNVQFEKVKESLKKKGKFANEVLLLHGTKEEHVTSILDQNFRLDKSRRSAMGPGIYLSRSAKNRQCGSEHEVLILCKALLGSIKFAQYLQKDDKAYDSLNASHIPNTYLIKNPKHIVPIGVIYMKLPNLPRNICLLCRLPANNLDYSSICPSCHCIIDLDVRTLTPDAGEAGCSSSSKRRKINDGVDESRFKLEREKREAMEAIRNLFPNLPRDVISFAMTKHAINNLSDLSYDKGAALCEYCSSENEKWEGATVNGNDMIV